VILRHDYVSQNGLLEGSTPWNEDVVQSWDDSRARFRAFAEKYAQACEERSDTRTITMKRGEGTWNIADAVRMQMD
jgi:hypothetical protein